MTPNDSPTNGQTAKSMLREDGVIKLVFAGDLVLDVPDADSYLSGIAPEISGADVSIGHLEVPHTRRGAEMQGDVPAPGAPPENLEAIARAGFDAVTLAGNHMADCGPEGIFDTISGLDRLGILHAGAGGTIGEARRPAILHCGDRRIALLSYNCVGPQSSWATPDRPGCAYLRIETGDGSPIAPSAPLEHMGAGVADILSVDVSAARAEADLVIVALHKGIVHTPVTLAPYERPVAHASIDAGADIVIGHHAHIVRGIEIYRGKPIFHGLGNGCVVTHALSLSQNHPARAEWARRRRVMFGFEPDPAYTLAPFHPEAVNAMLGTVAWHQDGRLEVGVIPVHVEAPGRPVIAKGEKGRAIIRYIESITERAGLPTVELGGNRGEAA